MKNDVEKAKGWFFGPWNSNIPIPVGFANEGINEPHYHAYMYEIYLVASGSSTVIVNGETIILKTGDALAVEPNEARTLTQRSPNYLHFVLQVPFVAGDKILTSGTQNK